jgi:hypothetical protein
VSKFIKQVLVLGFLDDGKYVPRAALFVTQPEWIFRGFFRFRVDEPAGFRFEVREIWPYF